MADLARIKRNVAKMAAMNAPFADIDGYIASEGVSLDDVRNYREPESEETQRFAPLSSELRAQPAGNYSAGVLSAGLKGFGEGLLSGAESALNGATLGGYGWASRKLGFGTDARNRELQAEAERTGLGGANKAANFAAGLYGAFGGLPKLTAGLSAKLLGSRLLGVPAAVAGGATDAGIQSAFDNDFSNSGEIVNDAALGGALGGALGLAGAPISWAVSKFSPKSMTKGLQGGLENVVDNPDAVRVMRKGIGVSDDVAREFMNKAPAAARGINSETGNMINNSLSRRIDVQKTIANQKQKYRDFMEANAGQEVLDFSPKAQLEAIQAESSYNPSRGLSRRDAETLLRNRAEQSGLGIYNDELSNLSEAGAQGLGINHFFSGNRRPYVRTLHNTLDKPDLRYSQNGRNYAIKKYTDNSTGKDFYDFVVLDNGELFNKFPTNSNYVANRFKNGVQDVSLNAQIPGAVEPIHGAAGNQFTAPMQDVSLQRKLSNNQQGIHPLSESPFNLTHNGLIVNPELPHISKLYEGLTPYQAEALDAAIISGAKKTNQKLGSLESLNSIKGELNDKIAGSQIPNPNNRISSLDTKDTVALREVKKRVDRELGTALKGRDRGYAKAKSMEEAYNQGRRYNPDAVGNDALIPSFTPLEQNAFTQGLFNKMTNNSLTGRNLAKKALKYENTLAEVLPKNRYNTLMEGLNRQNVRYERLGELGRQAQNKLVMPEKDWIFAREQLESGGAAKGAAIDWLNQKLRGSAYEKAAQNLLNPNFVGIEDNIFRERYPTLSNYLSAMFANQN